MLTLPVILLGILIASLYGALYHLVRAGGPGRLLLFILLSVSGFAAGHYLGSWQGWTLFPLGMLNVGMATLGSLLFLLAGDWLTRAGERH